MTKVGVLDIGVGNVFSVLNALSKIHIDSLPVTGLADFSRINHIILPGVGAFDATINVLEETGIKDKLEDLVLRQGMPCLGICLGMQLFSDKSEEGASAGLGWIKAQTVKFKISENQKRLKIPHMAWNETRPSAVNVPYLQASGRYYFTHQYHLKLDDSKDVVAWAEYGYSFPSIINHSNISGVQFHPEKSHLQGLNFLKNYFGYFL